MQFIHVIALSHLCRAEPRVSNRSFSDIGLHVDFGAGVSRISIKIGSEGPVRRLGVSLKSRIV